MMDIRQFSFDKNRLAGLIAKAGAAAYAFLPGIVSRFRPSGKAPDDFAARPTIPSWEEYEAASNAQILDRLNRNPSGLLSEQPFIDTLMNVRNAENNRKQTKHIIVAGYILAGGIVSLVFATSPPAAPPGQPAEQQRGAEKALENAASLLKEEFNLKLQGKDMEIKDLRRQISLLSQGQADLARQIKAVAKSAGGASAAANPAAAAKPRKAN
jgi:hypothetical protein